MIQGSERRQAFSWKFSHDWQVVDTINGGDGGAAAAAAEWAAAGGARVARVVISQLPWVCSIQRSQWRRGASQMNAIQQAQTHKRRAQLPSEQQTLLQTINHDPIPTTTSPLQGS